MAYNPSPYIVNTGPYIGHGLKENIIREIEDTDIVNRTRLLGETLNTFKDGVEFLKIEEKWNSHATKCLGKITNIKDRARILKMSEQGLSNTIDVFGRVIRSVVLVALCILGVVTILPTVAMISGDFRNFLDRNISLKSYKQIELEYEWEDFQQKMRGIQFPNYLQSQIIIRVKAAHTPAAYIPLGFFNLLTYCTDLDNKKYQSMYAEYSANVDKIRAELDLGLFSSDTQGV